MYYKRITAGGRVKVDVSGEQSLKHIEDRAKECHKVLILDVDGTLRCGKQRLHLLPDKSYVDYWSDEPNRAFTEFNEQCHNDTPIDGIIELSKELISSGNYYVFVLTSCTYSIHTGDVLLDQLKRWGIESDIILMRHPDNHLYPVEFKSKFLEQMNYFGDPSRVVMIDDNLGICDSARTRGITALQCENLERFNKI